jgi:hypothetical protein
MSYEYMQITMWNVLKGGIDKNYRFHNELAVFQRLDPFQFASMRLTQVCGVLWHGAVLCAVVLVWQVLWRVVTHLHCHHMYRLSGSIFTVCEGGDRHNSRTEPIPNNVETRGRMNIPPC